MNYCNRRQHTHSVSTGPVLCTLLSHPIEHNLNKHLPTMNVEGLAALAREWENHFFALWIESESSTSRARCPNLHYSEKLSGNNKVSNTQNYCVHFINSKVFVRFCRVITRAISGEEFISVVVRVVWHNTWVSSIFLRINHENAHFFHLISAPCSSRQRTALTVVQVELFVVSLCENWLLIFSSVILRNATNSRKKKRWSKYWFIVVACSMHNSDKLTQTFQSVSLAALLKKGQLTSSLFCLSVVHLVRSTRAFHNSWCSSRLRRLGRWEYIKRVQNWFKMFISFLHSVGAKDALKLQINKNVQERAEEQRRRKKGENFPAPKTLCCVPGDDVRLEEKYVKSSRLILIFLSLHDFSLLEISQFSLSVGI